MEALGRYRIDSEIGRGGCGIVYRALDPGIGRSVAIKTIHAEAESASGSALRERFRREARSAGSLSHPHIVTIHEFNDTSETMFIVMEYVDGPTLSEKMAGGAALPLDFVLSLLRSAADALDYAHSMNIVHRDVKPANFMITPAGQLKMTDFGIAKMLGSEVSLTNTGMIVGTAQYMSPEQIAAKPATGRSDQFSLAVIAYEMLTGQKPFQGDSWASVMHEIMSAEPPPVSQHRKDLGDSVTAVLRKAMAKDPAGRYPTCKLFADDLSEAVLGVTIQRTQPQAMADALKKPFPPPRAEVLPDTQIIPPIASGAAAKTRPRGTMIALLAGVLVLGAAGWFWVSSRKISDLPGKAEAPAAVEPTPPPAVATPSPNRAPAKSGMEPPPQTARKEAPTAVPASPISIAPNSQIQERQVVAAAVVEPVPPPPPAAAPVVTPPPAVEKASAPAAAPPVVQSAPAPAPVVIPTPPPAPVVAPVTRTTESEDARKAADTAAARRAVDDALNRYRSAFESKDAEALKSIWPSLGRNELGSFQNFFKIARTIKLQIRPVGDAEITAGGASIRARRTMAATDERGPMPQQDQTVKITFRRSANTMVIESIEPVNR